MSNQTKTAETFVNQRFQGLAEYIDDRAVLHSYLMEIVSCINEFHSQFTDDKDKEIQALRVQNSAYKTLAETAQKIKDHAQKEAWNNKAAALSVDSEKEMNHILTNEVESLQQQLSEKDKTISELRAWKESSMAHTPDMQAIGKAIGVKWGHSIHDKILPAIQEQQKEITRLKELIEDAYIMGRNDEKSKSEMIGWQQFKQENQL